MSLIRFLQDRSEFKQLRTIFLAICILVLEDKEKAYVLLEKLQSNNAQIANFQVIEPTVKDKIAIF